ncbi:putative claudin-25 [Hemicordylus capensis]|uniref:putative claudin-25 n=1 Tax=Hemicordylus capensis TaxID=884348 RepID=UPI0023034855|nr:putative claudin-25 [Hemicordylus capensis]
MAWHHGTVMQLGGMIVSLFGWLSSCVTTFVPLWKDRNLELNEMEVWKVGLWHACVTQDDSTMECKAFESLLALPLEFRVARILMVSSNGLGFLAFVFSICGLSCLKTRDEKLGLKRQLGIAGGVLFCMSGVATFVPISWIAYQTVQEFWDETVPEIVPRWEFGEALFLGWFAGFFLVLGGFLLICSACLLKIHKPCKQVVAQQEPEIPAPLLGQQQYSPPKNADLVI